ncbi:MAG: eCIS core domain-containing protein [Methylobacter sp.]
MKFFINFMFCSNLLMINASALPNTDAGAREQCQSSYSLTGEHNMKTHISAQTKKPDAAVQSSSAQSTQHQRIYVDNRPETVAQRKLAENINNGLHLTAQRQKLESLSGGAAQRVEDVTKPNNTGLPDKLKSGIEALSGLSMDNVKVHYNSSQPAQLNALAYAQGTDIHVAPGQERHLPHEAWHVVQQVQGRVQPTMQMKHGAPVNDDVGLENEADVMGEKAVQMRAGMHYAKLGPMSFVDPAGGLCNTIQCVPIGTGAGTDNDRNNFVTEPMLAGAQVSARGDRLNRAVITSMLVNGVDQVGKKLKHYMVVKNGFHFQFPIKHVLQPYEREDGLYVSNAGSSGGVRAGAAEGFGGNQDLHNGAARVNASLATSRDITLDREYGEENHRRDGANLNFIRTDKFANTAGPANMAGTLSIATTDQELETGAQPNFKGPFDDRGEAEMAGTVVINCDDLVGGALDKDALEAAIGQRIEHQRRELFQHTAGLRASEAVASSFSHEGGILSLLVGMVADDILAERARRHEAQIAQLAQLELARVEQEGQLNAQRERDRQTLRNNLIALGLVVLVAYLVNLLLKK